MSGTETETKTKPAPAAGKGVQTVAVTADESGMRVDRFLEARFPGLSFSHIQRIIRKGELRVNGKRAQPKDRLAAGQAVRIPPLRLDEPRPASPDRVAQDETRDFLALDHAVRGCRRPGVQQADGACRAGRLRHHAPPRPACWR